MKRRLFLFLSIGFVLFLFVGVFHHHPDGLKHEPCLFCYLTSHHSEYSSQAVLLFDPASVPLESILPSEQSFRSFLFLSSPSSRSPPSLLALS